MMSDGVVEKLAVAGGGGDVTASWNALYDRFYTRKTVYEMQWLDEGIDLDKYVVACAPYGGPVALVRDTKKVLLVGHDDDELVHPILHIFATSGKRISATDFPFKGLVGMGWTIEEHLVVVLDDGKVHTFDIFGQEVRGRYIELGSECQSDGVAQVVFWDTGFVVRTASSNQLFTITDYEQPIVEKLAHAPLSKPPTSMAVVPPYSTESGSVEVLLATSGGSIGLVDNKSWEDLQVDSGPFNKMVVSPTGALIACFNDEGTLYVFSTDFSKNLSKFVTKSRRPPRDVVWCGEDSVVLYWDTIGALLMVGPYGDFVKYQYDQPLRLVTEVDGVRIVANRQCEYLQRVPESAQDIFKYQSKSPAARLYDAAEAFEARDATADDNMRMIETEDDKVLAIEKCLDAAAREFDYKTQRRLLKAASYGMLFCKSWKSDMFVETCRVLRVLNAVRAADVGILLTYEQYLKLEIEALVDRLVARHHHLLALRVCEYMKMEPQRVLVHWACTKISHARQDVPDQQLLAEITAKLNGQHQISYSEVASAAYASNRVELATKLLDFEPRAADQVPLLIQMKQDERALDKAIDSGDTDLIYLALLYIQRSYDDDRQFFSIIESRPLARSMFVTYCKRHSHNTGLLKSYYYYFKMHTEAAHLACREAYGSRRLADRLKLLNVADAFFTDSRNQFAAQVTKEQIDLLRKQCKVELALRDTPIVDMSVLELIEDNVRHLQMKAANKICSDFKVPETQFLHIQVKTLAECHKWDELARLAASKKKKSPIGWVPFIEACVQEKQMQEATKYILKLPDYADKMNWLCNIASWKEAVELAVKEKDNDALDVIYHRSKNPAVQAMIDRILRSTPQ
eukprot:TRINITY_DN3823_c0_g1_i1.p1 TRINITY_DN3823_c0_g1~~TRINITY_DN3823_c0_g1_i1.p1  ORF type:complete len:855 (+),score=458.50 TRINITY_DN3823_c0_g1_i1:18-2582(+)